MKGIAVIDLVPGSHAERAGVKRGDRFMVVNGVEINNIDDYAVAIKHRGNSQTVIVEREGVLIEIEMAVGKPILGGDSN